MAWVAWVMGSMGSWVTWVNRWHGWRGSVKFLEWVKKMAWMAWVKIMVWVVWVHKILTWVKKMAWLMWVKILAWVAWIHKVGVGQNFGIGQKNSLCQNKMEWVKINIFQVFMVSMSCYFIILYRNYYVLCRLSGLAEAAGQEGVTALPPLLHLPVFKDP